MTCKDTRTPFNLHNLRYTAPNEEINAFQNQEDRLDLLFNSGKECSAPCWQDLRPGQSNKSEIQELLDKLNENEKTEAQCLTYSVNLERCTWTDLINEFAITIELREEKVEFLRFVSIDGVVLLTDPILETATQAQLSVPTSTESSNKNSRRLTIRDIFEKIGEPDKYLAQTSPSIEGDGTLVVTFLYSEGIIITGIYPDSIISNSVNRIECKVDISLDWHINGIYFANPDMSTQEEAQQFPVVLFLEKSEVLDWKGLDQVILANCDS